MPPFENHRLFSDHYLEDVLPTLDLWQVPEEDLRDKQLQLLELFAQAEPLLGGHEGQTEEHWIRPVLRALGFSFQVFPAVATEEGTRWPDYALFSNDADRELSEGSARTQAYFATSLAVADAKVWGRSLDRSTPSQDPYDRRNPSAQIDAYLRETDRRWAILTNGSKWRLYCRDSSYRLDTFYEIDLIKLLHAEPAEFKYFWLLFRPDAFEGQPNSLLDQILDQSVQFAARLTERVKGRIYEAVSQFVNGFFANSANQLDPYRDIDAAFQASLILLYRLLFGLYAESRDLLPLQNQTYRTAYSLASIKENLAGRLDVSMALLPTTTTYYDALQNLFRLLERGSDTLEIPKYNGGLFDNRRHPFLGLHKVGDLHLARGLDLLARVPTGSGDLAFVDYRSLDVRHLGDIYEGLLEYHARYAEVDMVAVAEGGAEIWRPAADVPQAATIRGRAPAGSVFLATGKGERRATGSYYTPQPIVAYMVEESVGRSVEALRAEFSGDELVERILNLKVCDPAMGSGHFLVEAVDYLARALVEAGSGGAGEPDETELQTWRRRVVERCAYGVDANPLAVELAKLSLWLATVSLGRPLSFLDNHLVHGNALIGTDLDSLASLRGQRGQTNLLTEELDRILPAALGELQAISERVSETLEDVHEKERLLNDARALLAPFRSAADVWVASRFGAEVNADLYGRLLQELGHPRRLAALLASELGYVATVRENYAFFHWELEFPEVFSSGGFDVVVTNPPYVNANELNNVLSEYEKPFWSGQFAAASGAYDLYILFIELCARLCKPAGYASLITPNKYLAAPYAKKLREHLVSTHRVLQILDASRVTVFDDPMVYPIVSVFQSHVAQDDEAVEVRWLRPDGGWEPRGEHPARYLDLLPEHIWAFLLLEDADLLVGIADRCRPTVEHPGLEPVASTTAAEADDFTVALTELHLARSAGWKVLNTGVIEPYAPVWGLERLAHARRGFLRPVIPHDAEVVPDRRRRQYDSAKLVFSKLCLRLTATVDPAGDYAGLNVNFIIGAPETIAFYGALYNSSLLRWVYEGYFGALRMGGGYMQVQAPQLRVLPLPRELFEPDFATNALVREILDLGERRRSIEAQRVESRIGVVDALRALLGVEAYRDADPSWVMPRQGAILAAIEDGTAPDLAEFWRVLRLTARDLQVEITPRRETDVLNLVQLQSAPLQQLSAQAEELDQAIDALVFRLYDLDGDDVGRIVARPSPHDLGQADEDLADDDDGE